MDRQSLNGKHAKDSPANPFVENVLNPAADTLVVEPLNAARQTINSIARPFLHTDFIEKRFEPTQTSQAEFLSGEWWVRNISSGLAAAAVYTVAGKLMGGSLRLVQGAGQKTGIKLLTSELGLSCRPVTNAIGKTGNLVGRAMLNEKVAQVAGAAVYDGLKETREGETNLGNMAGGAASFTVFEVGNALIDKGFRINGKLSPLNLVRVELAKSALRTIPGMAGSASQILASHVVSGAELPVDAAVWTQSAVTGGAMNAVLPWFQKGIGKGIDWATVKADKTLPYQRYNRNIQSPIVREFSDSNPEVRVKIHSGEPKAEGQRSRIFLPKGASEADQVHELAHVSVKKNLDRADDLLEVSRLIARGKIEDARDKYRQVRVKEEIFSATIEDAVKCGVTDAQIIPQWKQISHTDARWNHIAENPRYMELFDRDFAKLVANDGKPVRETDFNLRATALTVSKLHSIAFLSRPELHQALSKLSQQDEWIAYQIWKNQRLPATHRTLDESYLQECIQTYKGDSALQGRLGIVNEHLKEIPVSDRKKFKLIASEMVAEGLEKQDQLNRYIAILKTIPEEYNGQRKNIADLAKMVGAETLPPQTLQQLCDLSRHLTDITPRTLDRMVACINAWELEPWLSSNIAADVGQMPKWKWMAAKLAWRDAVDEHGLRIGSLSKSDPQFALVERDFWKHFDTWIKAQDARRLVFAEGAKRFGKELSNQWKQNDYFESVVSSKHSTLEKSCALELTRFLNEYKGDSFDLVNRLDVDTFESVFSSLRNNSIRQTLGLTLTFGKRWRQWLEQGEKLGRSSSEICDWLPIAPLEKLKGLDSFLLSNHNASIEKLSQIAGNWSELSPGIRKLPVERLYEIVAPISDISKLPDSVRTKAWYDAVQVFGRTKGDELCKSIKELPENDRLSAIEEAIKKIPSWTLKGVVREVSEDQLPRLAKAILSCPNDVLRADLLLALYGRSWSKSSIARAPEITRKLFEAVSECSDMDLSTIRKWSYLFPENSQSSGKQNRLNPVRDHLSRELAPKFLARVIFGESDYAELASQIAHQYPHVMRIIARNIYSFDSAKHIEQSGATMKEWNETKSLNAALGKAVSMTAAPEHVQDRSVTADILGELAKYSSPSERKLAVRALLKEVDCVIDGNNQQRTIFSLLSAARIYAADPSLVREEFFVPLESALCDSHRRSGWRLFVLDQLAKLERHGDLPIGLIAFPDVRVQPVQGLSAIQRDLVRTSAENGLRQKDTFANLLGAGELGKLFPNIFGDHKEGGIVGRPCQDLPGQNMDQITMRILENVRQHSMFKKLSEKDKVNVLWAGALHGTGIQASYSESGHGPIAANNCWGPLTTLGYSSVRISRIANLLKRYEELGKESLQTIARSLNHPSAIEQSQILKDAVTQARGLNTNDGAVESGFLSSRTQELNRLSVPLVTSELPKQFGIFSSPGDYALLAHITPNLEDWFMRHLSVFQSDRYSASVSLITPKHQHLYDPEQNVFPIISGPSEQISQMYRGPLSTGNESDWSWHVELSEKWLESIEGNKFALELDTKLRELGLGKSIKDKLSALGELRNRVSKYDSLDELYKQEGQDSSLAKAHRLVVESLTSDSKGKPLSTYNEAKVLNPTFEGLAILRRGKRIAFADAVPDQLPVRLPAGDANTLIFGSNLPADTIVIPKVIWQELSKRQLPVVILD